MRKTGLPIVIIAILFAIGLYIYYKLNDDDKFNWYETLRFNKEEPYDVDLFIDYLKKSHPNNKLIDGPFDKVIDTTESFNYFFIGSYPHYNEKEINFLYRRVVEGGQLFISANQFPDYFFQTFLSIPGDSNILSDQLLYHEKADSIHLKLVNKKMNNLDATIYYQSKYGVIKSEWKEFAYHTFFNESFNAREGISVQNLGNFGERSSNFIRILYGKGSIYLHLTPLLFTNFHLTKSENRKMVEAMLGYIPIDAKLHIDQYSQYYQPDDSKSNYDNYHSPSPLQFILGEATLRMAWYLLWGFLILYLIFKGRRKMKEIPVIPPKRNNTIEFAKTLGKLYFVKGSRSKIGLKKYKLVQMKILQSTGINWVEQNESSHQKMATKIGLPASLFIEIENEARRIKSTNDVSNQELMKFYNDIQSIYKKIS